MGDAKSDVRSDGGKREGSCTCARSFAQFWKDAYRAELPWYWNLLLSPFVLFLHSFRLLFAPCVYIYFRRVVKTVACLPCRLLCMSCWQYKDRTFPAKSASLGKNYVAEGRIVWKRGDELVDKVFVTDPETGNRVDNTPRHACLFDKEIEPADIQQGSLGNCWLMSALACVAEKPGVIRKVFVNMEHSYRGKYKVRIFDGIKQKWARICVDDRFPCLERTGRPIFARPHGGKELWCMLYEKAMAKFCGAGYAGLKGGHELWAFEAITGERVHSLSCRHSPDSWKRYDLVHYPSKENIRTIGLREHKTKSYDAGTVFEMLKSEILATGCFVCASMSSAAGQEEVDDTSGLVRGHAYSILDACSVKSKGVNFRIVKVRNPWGSFEWKGSWSDESALWDEHPKVKRKMAHEVKDDGIFHMAWGDFIEHFNTLDICERTQRIDDIQLDIRESGTLQGQTVGPFRGCAEGCFNYWICCQGCKLLYCPHVAAADSDTEEVV